MQSNIKIVTAIASVVLSLPLLAQSGDNGNYGNGDRGNSQTQADQNRQNQDSRRYGQNGNGNYDNNGSGNNRNLATIPAGTEFNVRLDRPSGNSELRGGDMVPATLVDDVSVNGQVVAPAGSRLRTRVTGSNSTSIRLDSMKLNGQVYRLSSNSVASNSNATGRNNQNDPANQSAAQRLGNLIGQGNNQDGNRNGNGQGDNAVYSFRLTSAARPSSNNNNGNYQNNNRDNNQ